MADITFTMQIEAQWNGDTRARCLRRWSVGLAVMLGLGVVDGRAQERAVALRFASPPSAVRMSADGRDLLIEFPGTLADGEAERAAKALGPLGEGYAEGYGAVRFRLSAAAQATLAAGTVEVTPAPVIVASAEDERRLRLLAARAAAGDGRLGEARIALRALAAERPGDPEPVVVLAEAERAAGHWQQALGLYDGARRLFPEATDLARDERALAVRHAPSVRTDASATFGPGGERAQTVTITGDLPLTEAWQAGASLQISHYAIRQLRRSGAAAAADYGGTKLLGGLDLANEWDTPGRTTRLGLFAAPRTLGGSIRQEVTGRLGTTAIGAFYHQPYWGTVTSFAADARRDQIGIAQTVPLPDRWEVQVGVGLVRYGVPSRANVAAGPSVVAGVSRQLPERWLPLDGMALRAGYRVEAEYLSHAALSPAALSNGAVGPNAAGPAPLLDTRMRETHTVYSEATMAIGPGAATALLGYAIDRYGGGGPQALLRYTGGDDDGPWAFSAEAGIDPSLDLRPRTLFHVGGNAVWRFGVARGHRWTAP